MDELEPEVERILAMPDGELHAILIAQGIDPGKFARRALELFEEIVATRRKPPNASDMKPNRDAIHLDLAHKRPDLPEYNDDVCPHCGGETDEGFGMAGGGMGVYAYCPTCEVVTSKSEAED